MQHLHARTEYPSNRITRGAERSRVHVTVSLEGPTAGFDALLKVSLTLEVPEDATVPLRPLVVLEEGALQVAHLHQRMSNGLACG